MRYVQRPHDDVPASKLSTHPGALQSVVCRGCGCDLPLAARFCSWCGASQSVLVPAAAPRVERKQATVLFADIADSTQLISGLDLESAIGRLQPVVATMVQIVRRFDGTVLRTLGDGIKAAFGAPHAREGHALLACRAALAMQDAMAALPSPTRIRIGLHSGEVVTGELDTGASVQQEAQGMTVHMASRVEQMAEPGGIYMTAECRALVSGYYDTASVGMRVLKGIPRPVEVFRLIGLKPAIASQQFRNSSLAPLYGRENELGILKQALWDAEQGTTSIIGIRGSAGVGKSRLCFEFSEWCRRRQIGVLEARALIYGQATPLLPVLEMMRAFFRIRPGLDPATARQRVEEKLLAADISLPDLSILLDFLGVPVSESAGQAIDSKVRHARLREHIRCIVRAIGRRTAVIVFEDLHWLDESSQDFIDTIVEAVNGTKIVVVLTYRPEWRPRWAFRSDYRELPLRELDRFQTGQLVRDLVGNAPALDRMIDHVAQQCGGNPFFAEELVRVLAQDGVLIGQRGNYRLAGADWHHPTLPATVEAVIGAQLDRLPEHDKTVLQIGAVIGKDFSLAVARQVAGMAEQEMKDLLDRLAGRDLVHTTTTVNGTGYAFRHPLIQEVAYAMQLPTRRAKLHAAVADALEGLPWGRLEEAASMLAHHREAAGQVVEAAIQLRRAALWIGRTNPPQAMAAWKKIRWLLRDQPRSPAIDEQRALASGRVLGFAWSVGLSAEDVRPYAEEALQFARDAGDLKHEALLSGAFGRVFAASGAADDYVALARQGVARAKASGDPGVFVACSGHLTQAYFFAGLLREGLATNDTALAASETRSRPQNGVVLGLSASQIFGFDVPQWLLCLRVRILALSGLFKEADASLRRALEVNPRAITPVVQYSAHLAAVKMAWHRSDAWTAKHHCDEIVKYAEQSGQSYLRVAALCASGLTRSAGAEFSLAVANFREALAVARESRTGLELEAKLVAFLADTYSRAGKVVTAARVATNGIEIARRRTDRIGELHASLVAVHTLCAGNDVKQRSQAGDLLARAEHLLRVTGAEFFRPMFCRVATKVKDQAIASDSQVSL